MPSSVRSTPVDPPIVRGQPPQAIDPLLPPTSHITKFAVAKLAVAELAQSSVPPIVTPPTQSTVDPPTIPEGNDTVLTEVSQSQNLEASVDAPSIELGPTRPSLLSKLAWHWPAQAMGFLWNIVSLSVLLAVVAAIPVVQLASLGYLLQAAANLASGKPWRTSFPGLKLAGKLATYAMLSVLLWIPVMLITDLAYSVQLLRPGTGQAAAWRAVAFFVAFAWLTWITWAALRGGRWWHMLWPAPLKFVTQAWRSSTWSRGADDLWQLFERTHFVQLWWLGFRAAAGALLWLVVPVSLMVIGLRAEQMKIAPLLGLIGAISLTWVMLFLPFLQILVAERNRFSAIGNIREVRKRFRHAPWAMGLSLIFLFALSIPLYLLRIEATPDQLTWAPSLVFVAMMFPSKLALGAAMGYAARRPRPRNFFMRWSARLLCVAASLFYVGALYIAQFIAWQGIYVMYFQHAVLVPVAS